MNTPKEELAALKKELRLMLAYLKITNSTKNYERFRNFELNGKTPIKRN